MARTPDGTVNIRWDWAAIEAEMTSAGHQPRWPDMTAQAAARAAMKKVSPNQGFQLGVTAITGIHSISADDEPAGAQAAGRDPGRTRPPRPPASTPPGSR